MCGIIGITQSKNLGRELYLGLLNLQHRGQDAAGILSYDFQHPNSDCGVSRVRKVGSVTALEDRLEEVKGDIGIGHVRYPTIGSCELKDVQPLFLTYPDFVGMVHNGNTVNYLALKRELEERKRGVFSNSDSEIILNLLSERYAQEDHSVEGFSKAVQYVYEKVIGAYAILSLIPKLGLVAFRDPYGIRPLVYGKRRVNGRVSYGFSSEDCALRFLGFKEIKDLEPGTMALVDRHNRLHLEKLAEAKHAHCVFEWVYFAEADSTMEGRNVYNARAGLGKALAKKVKKLGLHVDVVIPVPDTSRAAAIGLSRALGIPFEEGLIRNKYVGRTFIMPTQHVREDAVSMKLKPIRNVLADKDVLIVDDSIVRGTTSKKIIQLVRKAGARKVYYASTFPLIIGPCFYGIDFQRGDELIGNGKTVKEVCGVIGADALIYNDIKALPDALGFDDLCLACVSGKYPTSTGDADELSGLRKKHQSKICKRG